MKADYRKDLREWLLYGVSRGENHCLIVEAFDEPGAGDGAGDRPTGTRHYPVFYRPYSLWSNLSDFINLHEVRGYAQSRRVVEVYALHLDLEPQMAEKRAWRLSTPPICGQHEDCKTNTVLGFTCMDRTLNEASEVETK